MQLFDYLNTIRNAPTWRSEDDWIFQFAILFQIIRGMLYGIVLLLIRDSFLNKKLAWLRLWAIVTILCLFNTSSPAPGSIEGFIYLTPSNEPLIFRLGGMLEILMQTLLFSVMITFKIPRKKAANLTD